MSNATLKEGFALLSNLAILSVTSILVTYVVGRLAVFAWFGLKQFAAQERERGA